MSTKGIRDFKSQLQAHEIVDDAVFIMTEDRRTKYIFPEGAKCVDYHSGVVFTGDGITLGGVSTGETVQSIFPDNAGNGSYQFKINDQTSKLALYEKVGGSWVHRLDFGSVVTDEFVTTVPMGGLQVKGDDGYNYNLVRASPTGNGIAAVLGNYNSGTFVASNLEGAHLVWETQEKFLETLNDSATPITGTTFSITINPSDHRMHYGGISWLGTDGKVFLGATPGENKTILYRSWTTDENDKILHQTIKEEEFSSTDDVDWLKSHKAEEFHLTAGQNYAELANSIPAPTFSETPARTWHWEFKEPVTFLGANTAFKINWVSEALVRERIASQEWVDANVDPNVMEYKGGITVTDFNALTAAHTGNVYKLTDAGIVGGTVAVAIGDTVVFKNDITANPVDADFDVFATEGGDTIPDKIVDTTDGQARVECVQDEINAYVNNEHMMKISDGGNVCQLGVTTQGYFDLQNSGTTKARLGVNSSVFGNRSTDTYSANFYSYNTSCIIGKTGGATPTQIKVDTSNNRVVTKILGYPVRASRKQLNGALDTNVIKLGKMEFYWNTAGMSGICHLSGKNIGTVEVNLIGTCTEHVAGVAPVTTSIGTNTVAGGTNSFATARVFSGVGYRTLEYHMTDTNDGSYYRISATSNSYDIMISGDWYPDNQTE